MAIDGIFLRHLKKEIEEKILGGRIDKIYQPNREEILFNFRLRGGVVHRLLFSIRANSARVHFTANPIENPQSPPMFCMLLRKRLSGAKLVALDQPDLERLLRFKFEAQNNLGDVTELNVIIELMGKYSNFILTDGPNIIDSIKRVDGSMSSRRMVQPGLNYELPPPQGKVCILDCDITALAEKIKSSELELHKALLNTLQGVSPSICKEIALKVKQTNSLKDCLDKLKQIALQCSGSPWLVYGSESQDFSYVQLLQYGQKSRQISTFSQLLDEFYHEKDNFQRLRIRAHDILQILTRIKIKLEKKINLQTKELESCREKENLKLCGDLITANIYNKSLWPQKHGEYVLLPNFYSENLHIIKISLDVRLTPSQNAQAYYKKYKKAKTAEQLLKQQINLANQDLIYIGSVFDALSRAGTEEDLQEIKNEIVEQGYVKRKVNFKKTAKRSEFLNFTSKNGFLILVGRNNKQNDELTFKKAKKLDVWLHVKDIPGSHAVIITKGLSPTKEDIIEAAMIAAFHSKAKNSSNVPVDYTNICNVSKPKGAKPGMVIYNKNRTLFVDPSIRR